MWLGKFESFVDVKFSSWYVQLFRKFCRDKNRIWNILDDGENFYSAQFVREKTSANWKISGGITFSTFCRRKVSRDDNFNFTKTHFAPLIKTFLPQTFILANFPLTKTSSLTNFHPRKLSTYKNFFTRQLSSSRTFPLAKLFLLTKLLYSRNFQLTKLFPLANFSHSQTFPLGTFSGSGTWRITKTFSSRRQNFSPSERLFHFPNFLSRLYETVFHTNNRRNWNFSRELFLQIELSRSRRNFLADETISAARKFYSSNFFSRQNLSRFEMFGRKV